jgi:hypothetical protein
MGDSQVAGKKGVVVPTFETIQKAMILKEITSVEFEAQHRLIELFLVEAPAPATAELWSPQ